VAPGKNLDVWLTARGIDGDFTVVDTSLLNRYFREHYLERRQGGTHTLQRNLIQLFGFLARERGHPSPYTDGLNRYAEVKGRPKTLGAEFVDDLLEVTGGVRRATSRRPGTMRSSASFGARGSGAGTAICRAFASGHSPASPGPAERVRRGRCRWPGAVARRWSRRGWMVRFGR
jgi:hypothetical protein